MKIQELLTISLIIVAIALLVILIRKLDQPKPEEKEYWEKPGFKTDTIVIKHDYILPKSFSLNVPPATVKTFPINKIENNKIVLNDSLLYIIDSLKNHIFALNARYLLLFPEAPKLISGLFLSDSLNIALLNTDGTLDLREYGVNYDRFAYTFVNGQLTAKPIKLKHPITTAFYIYGGYDFAFKEPTLGADYSISKGKVRVKGNTFLTIENKPQLSAQATLGYRIK